MGLIKQMAARRCVLASVGPRIVFLAHLFQKILACKNRAYRGGPDKMDFVPINLNEPLTLVYMTWIESLSIWF